MPQRPSRPLLPPVLLAVLLATSWLAASPVTTAAAGSRLLVFGENSYGEVGDGTNDARPGPVEISGMGDIVAVAAGSQHSLALRSDGRVLAWGRNNFGQLGDGTHTNRNTPALIPGLHHVVDIAAGLHFGLALRSDGSVWQWGGQMTDTQWTYSMPDLLEPTLVPGLTAQDVGGGLQHKLFGTLDGAGGWGYNHKGQLGDGSTTDSMSPVFASIDGSVVQVEGGFGHSLYRMADGSVWSTGLNSDGQLGIGSTTQHTTPVEIAGLTAIQIGAGYQHSIALRPDGTVVAWGDGDGGALGYTNAVMEDRSSPNPVPSLTGVTRVTAGLTSSGAINADGLWTFGWGTGVPGVPITGVPVLVAGTAGATDASIGSRHGLILIDGVPLDLPEPVDTTMSVELEPEPAYVGEPVTFTVTVDPAPDMGSIGMGDAADDMTQTAVIDPITGEATFTETFDSAGTYTRFFDFDGVPGFEGFEDSLDVDVERRATSVAVAGPSTRTVGRTQTLTVDAMVTPPTTGDVQVYDVTATPVAISDPIAVDADDGSASVEIGPLSVGAHELEVRYLGSVSHLASTSSTIDVTVVEGPVVGVPVVTLPTGKKAGVGTLAATIAWTPSTGAIDHYELEERVDGGTWSSIAIGPSATSVGRVLTVGRSYDYRARAIDADDHVGPWVSSATFRGRLTENTSGAVWYRGAWSSTVRSSSYSGGSARPATAKNARATLTFTGSGVTWLATVGPSRGRVSVYIDGTLVKTIDLRASKVDTRRIVFSKTWMTAGRHTITLSNVATSGRPRLDLDAFLTWTGG